MTNSRKTGPRACFFIYGGIVVFAAEHIITVAVL
jgi:hypothetical protein